MDNNVRIVLFEVIGELLVWEENLSGVNLKRINKIIYSFDNLLIVKGIQEFPQNLSEFINVLKNNTLKELGFCEDEITKSLINERIIENGRINIKFKSWYEDMISVSEEEQEAMLEFLQLCRLHREKEDEEEYSNYYRLGRSLVNNQNMIMSNLKFQSHLQKKFPDELRKVISKWRKDINIIKEVITVCPVCGKQIEFTFGDENFCSDICKYYMNKEALNFESLFTDENMQYSEFTEGIYRFILLPSIGENRIYKKLSAYDNLEVELYPNMDEYDIKVKMEELELLIDIKDVSTPFTLVELLKKNNGINKLERNKGKNIYLVIPEHRRVIYLNENNVDYKRDLLNTFQEEGLDIKVLYEKELYRKINDMLNDDF
ncbi:MAG: hypothetical protein E7211_16895 [Clostridium lundense]|nr:hypothetical protein [Clostridium lundense]